MKIEFNDDEIVTLYHLMVKQRGRLGSILKERELVVKIETLTGNEIIRRDLKE